MNAKPPTLASITSCLSDYDPDALPVAQAQRIIRDYIHPVAQTELLALCAALGRVLAADIVSPIDVPSHDNSAMDGFALRSEDLGDGDTVLRIAGTAYAGRSFAGIPQRGECVRIMTGAVMPPACDTVVPQEFVQFVDGEAGKDLIRIPTGTVKSGDNRRLRGEDLATGQPALKKGRILRPADIGMLASLGIPQVPVMRRLRVAFFSTGDELRPVGQPLEPGCVYDSNRYTLYGMLTRLGCEIIDLGVVRDDPAALEAAFRAACKSADAVITSGGVSVGEADYTKQIMAKLGDVNFWKIGMRPGRPMAFGRIVSEDNTATLFGLPGNPVAVMVTFYFIARDALLSMMGAQQEALPLVKARAESAIRKRPGRTEYQRGIVSRADDGSLQVCTTGSQGSGVLRSMSEANCMIVLQHDQDRVNAGDAVDIVLFDGLI
jgi:molybdopterin molybdotransferase